MARPFEIDAALLTISRSLIDESRQLLASLRSESFKDRALLTHARTIIGESRRLLARLEHPPTPTSQPVCTETTEVGNDHKQELSVRVFGKGSVFAWTLTSPDKRMVGFGTADTEHKARIDAFCAGMTYIDRSKSQSAPDNTRLQ